MSLGNTYLTRYATEDRKLSQLIDHSPELIIVIPSFKEPNIKGTLDSLLESYHQSSELRSKVLVIIVVNHSETYHPDELKLNQETIETIKQWKENNSDRFLLYELLVELPRKKAGVGLARKIGMDEAVRVYEKFERDGIIVNLDADCKVSQNYLTSIHQHFEDHPKSPAASIHYEHQVNEQDVAILNYELHLRYFINAQRFCHLPYSYQTIGSSMAVRSKDYQRQGGMNSKKAGEDFYFIQKMLLLGNYSEINECTVFPSSRQSDRVPFGTGRAMMEFEQKNDETYSSYHPESFILLQQFIEVLPELYTSSLEEIRKEIALPVWEFLTQKEFEKALVEIKKKSTNLHVFQKHFFSWFDGFQLMKYLHFSRDTFYPNQSIEYCLKWLFTDFLHRDLPTYNLEALKILREFDRKGEAVVPWY